MPVVYSFSTTFSPPASDLFPCLDASGASLPSVLSLDGVTLSRGTPYIDVDLDNRIVMYSDDGVLTSLNMELPYQQAFTFETEFLPSLLPDSLDKLDKYRLFIGVFDKQDNAGGILISKVGIALVSSFGLSALVLPGSQHLFTEGATPHTLRIVVDGDKDLMYLYVTKTSELPITGHVLRYTTAAPVTPAGTPDSFRLELMGQADKTTMIKVVSLRSNCTAAMIPNQRPIADPGMDQTTNVGSAVTHDGRNSYDPEGEQLTYSWSLVDAPDNSRYKISGIDGSTTDDGDADGFTNVFDGGPGAFSVDNAPLLQPGDSLVINNVVYAISTDRWSFNSTTKKWDRDVGTWVDSEVVITEDVLPDTWSAIAWAVFHGATYFVDQTASTAPGIPDVAGVYIVQLIVNDGELNSLPATALLNVAQTSVTLGCVPELSWVWNLLSDFWNLLEDREIVETVWSGFAQAAAAQLMTAWQIDYNKSLLDIQRVFQRRWLGYDTKIEEAGSPTIRIVRGQIVSSDLIMGAWVGGMTLQLALDAGPIQTITFVGSGALSVDTLVTQINLSMGFTLAKKASIYTLVPPWLGGGYGGPYGVYYGVGGPPSAYVIAEYLVLDYPLLLRVRPGGTANTALGFSTTTYTQNDLSGNLGSALSGTKLYAFEATEPPILDFDAQNVGPDDLLVFLGNSYRVQKTAMSTTGQIRGLSLLDPLPDPLISSASSWLVPSVVVSTTNYESSLITAGDIALFEIKETATGSIQSVLCNIMGVREGRVGFDPTPLLEFYDGMPDNYQTTFVGVQHARYIPVDSLVTSIPRLQEVIKKPPSKLSQNTDFTVEVVGDQNAIVFKSGTFGYMDPPPDTLWAEITYLDNRPTIEANFGGMVNFTLDHLQTVSADLDYLSAVRGLWWAYFGGPSLAKVRAGVQILLGLPFSEADGVITSLLPNFSATEGRIIIEDTKAPNNPRTYYYPLSAGLGINSDTGLPFALGDSVKMFTPLCGGVEVYDYINSPTWAKKYASQGKFSEIDKLFRFLVRADVDTFNVINLSFAIDFVRKIKPSYTYPLFVMLKRLKPTEVDVSDAVTMKAMLDLHDSFCSQFTNSAFRWDDTDESGNLNYTYDQPVDPQFLHDTHRLCPVESLWVHIYYIHPGVGGWFFDTIWAYDDGGTKDILKLHGPDSSPPPPYGPAVGTITFDAAVAAGTYHRIRPM